MSSNMTREEKKQKKREEKYRPYRNHLHTGEKVQMEVEFSIFPQFAYYMLAALVMIIVQRQNLHLFVNALCGIGCMWMALNAAQVCLYVQNSVILITNQRIFGLSGDTKCDVDLSKVKKIQGRSVVLVDGGPYNFVRLKNLKHRDAVLKLLGDLLHQYDEEEA